MSRVRSRPRNDPHAPFLEGSAEMNVSEAVELVAYTRWANGRALDAAAALTAAFLRERATSR